MQMVGQPARDLSRHFVQRWNFLLRQRESRRPRPYLLPPPDFVKSDLRALGLEGTCEVQILRSAAMWNIGTPETERSITNAYIMNIRDSEHFVYIENQFFITSCRTDDHQIKNGIGDALVERIKRAHAEGTKWRAIIVIPLMPGFEGDVMDPDSSSVRLIMQWQFYSICRGESSIFKRLEACGINPRKYIDFYSLRSWGKIGEKQKLVTEQLYIHAKVMIVDDRVVIIGSANINERSMLGHRDSEIAAVIRDRDMVKSRMAGKEYFVGRFAHDLRIRLMREHLGINVERKSPSGSTTASAGHSRPTTASEKSSVADPEPPPQPYAGEMHALAAGEGRASGDPSFRSLQLNGAPEPERMPPTTLPHRNADEPGLPNMSLLPALPDTDDLDIGGPPIRRVLPERIRTDYPALTDLSVPKVSDDCMLDPVSGSFYKNIWSSVANNNTEIFRLIFRPQPDNQVTDWQTYGQWNVFAKAYNDTQFPSGSAKEGTLPNEDGSTDARLPIVPRETALQMLDYVQGNLVVFPYKWLMEELDNGRFNFPIDGLAPLTIFI
jgi:hypothetical protein